MPRNHLLAGLFCLACAVQSGVAQTQTPVPADDEVLRVRSVLVQTDVRVYDRKGRFVDNLKREDFELTVDGTPLPVAFLELVQAGSATEAAQLAAARTGKSSAAATPPPSRVLPETRGRTTLFFIDDLHLEPDSLVRARKAVLSFVEHEMGENDQAAVFSTSNQPGFLQQVTDNKAVLRAALARLAYRHGAVRDPGRPPMTDYEAYAIDQNDRDMVSYFVTMTLASDPMFARNPDKVGAEVYVRQRATQLVAQSASLSNATLAALRSFVASLADAPGQKLAFFISDGFMLDEHNSDAFTRLRRVTDTAARAGVIFYTLDARGLEVGLPDAASDAPADPFGTHARAGFSQSLQRQDALNAIAVDTGGRALRNTNALDAALTSVVAETARYYLIAWQPAGGDESKGKFKRLRVRIKDHPELTLRVRQGFFDPATAQPARANSIVKAKTNTPHAAAGSSAPKPDELIAALSANSAGQSLPVALYVGYLRSGAQGAQATVSLQIARAELAQGDDATAGGMVELAGLVLDADGKGVGSFRRKLTVPADAPAESEPDAPAPPLGYSGLIPLAPGLYQVRVAARDVQSGRTGSALAWLEIPDTSPGHFALSSIFIGTPDDAPRDQAGEGAAPAGIRVSADRRFARDARLRFMLYVYNAAHNAGSAPDIILSAAIRRNGQPIIVAPPHKLANAHGADAARILYAAEVPLAGLPAGTYTLAVAATDAGRRATATQDVRFTIK